MGLNRCLVAQPTGRSNFVVLRLMPTFYMAAAIIGRIETEMSFRSTMAPCPDLDTLVDGLYDLSKVIGPIDATALDRVPQLLGLPRYAEIEDHAERCRTLLIDLEASVASLPSDYRLHARLLLSFDHAGTNLTHRRSVFESKNIPYSVTKWKERYTLAQVASELLARAGRSIWLDRGPGYLHDRIGYRIVISPDDALMHTCIADYDIRIVRDATYLFLVANDDTSDGAFEASPWKVQPSHDRSDVGNVQLDPSVDEGAIMSVVYLGRPHSQDELCHISMVQGRKYRSPLPEYVCQSDTPARPIELELVVECPRTLAPSYDRITYASGARTAPELAKEHIIRDTDDPMTFHIPVTKPPRSYAIRWTM